MRLKDKECLNLSQAAVSFVTPLEIIIYYNDDESSPESSHATSMCETHETNLLGGARARSGDP
jgi:hypothetical protein